MSHIGTKKTNTVDLQDIPFQNWVLLFVHFMLGLYYLKYISDTKIWYVYSKNQCTQ